MACSSVKLSRYDRAVARYEYNRGLESGSPVEQLYAEIGEKLHVPSYPILYPAIHNLNLFGYNDDLAKDEEILRLRGHVDWDMDVWGREGKETGQDRDGDWIFVRISGVIIYDHTRLTGIYSA